jgi:hypothetical protein
MFGKMLTVMASKHAGRPLTLLIFTTLVAGSGNAADLQPRIDGTPFTMAAFERFLTARHQKPVSPQARKQLFQEFLRWSAARKHR